MVQPESTTNPCQQRLPVGPVASAALGRQADAGLASRPMGDPAPLKEDIEALGLRAEVDTLAELVRNASEDFPEIAGRGEITYRLREDVEDFLRYPRAYRLPSRHHPGNHSFELEELLGRDGIKLLEYAQSRPLCPACIDEGGCIGGRGRPYMHSFLPIHGSHYHYLDGKGECMYGGWYLGAIDMLGFLNGYLRAFEKIAISTEDRRQNVAGRPFSTCQG
jgi:hypothetical protein